MKISALQTPWDLSLPISAAQAFDYIGLPEGIYPIAEATLYLATAPKSNSAGAYFKAMKKIEEEGQVSVPRHLADGNRDAAATGQGKDYVYPHDEEGHFTPQQYLPKRLLGTYFYAPSQEGYESQVTARLEMWREAQRKALGIERREDVPAYERRRNQRNEAEDQIAWMKSAPGFILANTEIRWTKNIWISNPFNPCFSSLTQLSKQDINSLYLPVEDLEPTAPNLIKQGVDFILAEKEKGNKILVACGAGMNRSTAFCMAALKEVEGLSLLDAFKEIKRKHPESMPHKPVWESFCSYYKETTPYLDVMKLSI